MNQSLKTSSFLGAAAAALLLFFIAYSGHFNNAFHFDDIHTITENIWIKDLGNIPKYFSDATTTSTLPVNQAWRPGLTTLNAIDFAIAGKSEPHPLVFHIHIFIGVLLSGVMLFFLFLHFLNKSAPKREWNHWLALFGATFFLVHTANAETINYIIARSDTASTFWVLAGFCMYIFSEKSRKYLLYAVPMIIGFLIKEPAIMLVPLLFVYEWTFGKLTSGKKMQFAVLFTTAVVLYLISRALTPALWNPGGVNRWDYLMTQTFVLFHYIANFALPFDLAIDTDWTPITSIFDDRILFGIALFISLLTIIYRCNKQEKLKPIAFGLSWFLIALAPTSSIIPLAEVLNDHRVYFPYIGLVLVVACALGLLIEEFPARQKRISPNTMRNTIIGLAICFLGAHAYGAHHRSEIWKSEGTIWEDCAKKCPKNGRGLMNYGNQLLNEGITAFRSGDTLLAKKYFAQTDTIYGMAQKVWPEYSSIYVNIGALREWQDRDVEAEANYRRAITLRIDQPESYYWFADFLVRNNRVAEAIPFVKQGLALSPSHIGLNRLDLSISQQGPIKDAVTIAREQAEQNPTADNYINLSLGCYNILDYAGTIAASEKAINLQPDYAEAYNNICAANNMLGHYDEAVAAGQKAIALAPNNELFKNNLQEALRQQSAQKEK